MLKRQGQGHPDASLEPAKIFIKERLSEKLILPAAENSMGFLAPGESFAFLPEAIDFTRQGQVSYSKKW